MASCGALLPVLWGRDSGSSDRHADDHMEIGAFWFSPGQIVHLKSVNVAHFERFDGTAGPLPLPKGDAIVHQQGVDDLPGKLDSIVQWDLGTDGIHRPLDLPKPLIVLGCQCIEQSTFNSLGGRQFGGHGISVSPTR